MALYEHLSILRLRLPGLRAVATPGSPRLALGACLTVFPTPLVPAANGSSLPALRSPGRRGLGRIKQAEGGTLVIAEAQRHALGQAYAAPQRESKPRKCGFRDEIYESLSQPGRLPRGTEILSPPQAPYSLVPLRPLPEPAGV